MDITASPKCFVCKKLMSAVKHLIKHKGDKGSIERAMQTACSRMGKLKGKCSRFVQRHGGQIVDLMTKHAGAGRICKLIGVCKKAVSLEDCKYLILKNLRTQLKITLYFQVEVQENMSVSPMCELRELFDINEIVEQIQSINQLEETTDTKNGPICVICEIMVARLKASVDTKEKRDLVLRSILFSCNLWPNIIRETCTSVVQSFGAAILDLMSKIEPHNVCHFLGTNANFTTSEGLDFLQDFNNNLSDFLDTNCA